LTRVLVTGGAGFLGSHVAKRLVEEGHEVSIADDLSAGSMENLNDLGVDVEVFEGDLREPSFARKAVSGVESVFHFAAEVGSVAYLHGSQSRELAAFQSNVLIDTNVFRACSETKVSRVVYASSVSVYPIDEQMGSRTQFKEEDADRKVNPEGGYGWSKFLGEKQLGMMSETASGVARIFHAYGKNIYLRPDRSQVIGSLIRKAVGYPEEGFEVWGDGSQRRCFIYVDDAVEAMFRLWDYIGRNSSLTVNIGSTEETSVGELAKKVIGLSGKQIPLKFDTTKPTGALDRRPDLGRISSVLDWAPSVPFDKGLKATFGWAQDRLSRQRS
jgi:nucleoside-diphosphate-sugar epimerase